MSEANPSTISFAFVANLLDVDCAIPVEIVEGHFLKRASNSQREIIRGFISRHRMTSLVPLLYERDLKNPTSCVPIREEDWRYYVIEFVGGNEVLCELAEAAALTAAHLRLSPVFVYFTLNDDNVTISPDSPYGVISSPGDAQMFGDFSMLNLEHQSIGIGDFTELRICNQEMQEIRSKFPPIRRACSMFHQLCTFPPAPSNLSTLGYFAVIESILTHDPHGSYDSLSHQIKTKIQLLSCRLPSPIDYSSFPHLEPLKVWSKLYAYRSRIAHGADISFDGDLQALKSALIVEKFLRKTIRLILRHALREPQLYLDLQKC